MRFIREAAKTRLLAIQADVQALANKGITTHAVVLTDEEFAELEVEAGLVPTYAGLGVRLLISNDTRTVQLYREAGVPQKFVSKVELSEEIKP